MMRRTINTFLREDQSRFPSLEVITVGYQYVVIVRNSTWRMINPIFILEPEIVVQFSFSYDVLELCLAFGNVLVFETD